MPKTTTRERTSEVLFTTEGTGYSLLLQFNQPNRMSDTDQLIVEHPALGDGRCRVLVRRAHFAEHLLYRFDHFVSAQDTVLALNLIERHAADIHKAMTK